MSIQSIIRRSITRTNNTLTTTSSTALNSLTTLTLWDTELACGASLVDVLEPLTHAQQVAEAQALVSHDDSWAM